MFEVKVEDARDFGHYVNQLQNLSVSDLDLQIIQEGKLLMKFVHHLIPLGHRLHICLDLFSDLLKPRKVDLLLDPLIGVEL